MKAPNWRPRALSVIGVAAAAMLAAQSPTSSALARPRGSAPMSLVAFSDYLKGVAVIPRGGARTVDRTLTEHWNGTSWQTVPSPND